MKKTLDKEFESQCKKIDLYLETVSKGFFLFEVNEYDLLNEVILYLNNRRLCCVFDLSKDGVAELLHTIACRNITEHERIYILKGTGSQSELFDMLDNINLRRDVLAASNRIYVFILPSYAVTYVSETLQNLYSYCTLKLRFLRIYPNILSASFPEKKLMLTKEARSALKAPTRKGKTDLEYLIQCLDYYSNVRIGGYNLDKIINQVVWPEMRKINDNLQISIKEKLELYARFAKMLQVQKRYEDSEEIYGFILTELENFQLSDMKKFHLNIQKEIAQNEYYLKRYNQAVRLFTEILTECILTDEGQYDNEIIINTYICLAVCLCQKKEYNKAVRILEKAGSLDSSGLSGYSYFTLWYDYYIVKMKVKEQNPEDNEKILVSDVMDKFAGKKMNVIESAMLHTLCAWIFGVFCGETETALDLSLDALEQKRRYFWENDIRIADSHYVTAMIYYIQGEYEKAEICMKKAFNIVNNYSEKKEYCRTVQKMQEAIREKRFENK